MIEITDLHCVRNEQVLFQKVSFILNHGEALQVIGPNGVGKSTLLRIISQKQLPGSVCYIGHKHNLHPSLTVYQNLKFLQTLLNPSDSSDNIKLDIALQYFNMQNFANKLCGNLSAGQLQRVSLARLCLTKSKIWLLDEPLSNLDPTAQQLFINLCQQHLISNGIIICATHTILEFALSSSKIIKLQEYA